MVCRGLASGHPGITSLERTTKEPVMARKSKITEIAMAADDSLEFMDPFETFVVDEIKTPAPTVEMISMADLDRIAELENESSEALETEPVFTDSDQADDSEQTDGPSSAELELETSDEPNTDSEQSDVYKEASSIMDTEFNEASKQLLGGPPSIEHQRLIYKDLALLVGYLEPLLKGLKKLQSDSLSGIIFTLFQVQDVLELANNALINLLNDLNYIRNR
jgi:hypothetical protein